MSTSDDTVLVRVERGTASQEELAALTAVLLARAVAGRPDPHPPAATPAGAVRNAAPSTGRR